MYRNIPVTIYTFFTLIITILVCCNCNNCEFKEYNFKKTKISFSLPYKWDANTIIGSLKYASEIITKANFVSSITITDKQKKSNPMFDDVILAMGEPLLIGEDNINEYPNTIDKSLAKFGENYLYISNEPYMGAIYLKNSYIIPIMIKITDDNTHDIEQFIESIIVEKN